MLQSTKKIKHRCSFHQSQETKEKLRQIHIGKKCSDFVKKCISQSNYKEGDNYGYQSKFYKPIMKNMVQQCSLCGITEKLVTHHIDFNYKNNIISNIMVLCGSCHTKLHNKSKNRNDKGKFIKK